MHKMYFFVQVYDYKNLYKKIITCLLIYFYCRVSQKVITQFQFLSHEF